MDEPKYELRELTKEEATTLTKDMQEVLKKHDAEMQVTSQITLFKRVHPNKEEGIPSPFPLNENGEDKTNETKQDVDASPEEGS